MKIYIDTTEWYPVYVIDTPEPGYAGYCDSIELSDAEFSRVTEIEKEFELCQHMIEERIMESRKRSRV
jgi:hypothetical protein